MNDIKRIVYQFWTDDNEMSKDRAGALSTSINFGVDHVLVTPANLEEYVVDGYPIHPAYRYLSLNHRSDYLRCYFMHLHGGGYADIKYYDIENNWVKCFDVINDDLKIDVIGQKEIVGGTPIREYDVTGIREKLVANGYFVVRPHSDFTSIWFYLVNELLDSKIVELKRHPSADVFGTNRDYPIRWAQLMGEIFHKVCYFFRNTGKVCPLLVSGRSFERNYR